MAGELIFITGAAGFIGTHIVHQALKAGYRVRGSVRREAQVKQLQAFFGPEFGPNAQFVIVQDITKPNAYDGLLDGVDYVIHVASPVAPASTDWKKDHIDPAVLGTTTMLEAARDNRNIKRMVITASIADVIPWGGWPKDDEPMTEDHPYEVDVSPNLDFKIPFAAYRASKILAVKATEEFIAQKAPHYGVTTIHPTFVFGRNLLQTSADDVSGMNKVLWFSLKGSNQILKREDGVHVLDVADAHIKALRPDIATGQKFLLAAPRFTWTELLAFVKERYPREQWGDAPSPPPSNKIKASKAEEMLGIDYRDWKQQVIDVVDQQLELLKE